ncbi:MAG: ABC transporter ATP-binding protein/permease [Oscillibacter sp.]|nr:ABC transporter ATP-binding protein/permease [Oscillibacter sp.]
MSVKRKTESLASVVKETVSEHRTLTAGLIALIAGAVTLGLLPPLVLERIVDRLTAGKQAEGRAALLYFGLLAASGLFEAGQNVAITVFGQKITHGLRSAMCGKLRRLPAAYFTGHESGSVTSRFVNDVDTVDTLFTEGIVGMFADGCRVIGLLTVIFVKSAGLGLLLLASLPLLFWMTRAFQQKMLRAQLQNREAVARAANHVPETIRNIRMIRSFYRQSYMEERYDGYIQEGYRATEKSNFCDSVYSPIVIFVSSCIVAAVMVFAAAGGGLFRMSVGAAVAVTAYVAKVFGPLESIGMEIQNIQSAAAGVRRIDEFLREEEREEPDPALTAEKLLADSPARVEFQQVEFGYGTDHPVLRDLTFTAQPGETVILTGRTGAGKSTAFRLLLGLYAPSGGRVTVCGADAAAIPDGEKRKLFGVVPQDFRLVPGTVGDQISLFDPAVGPEQIRRAAELAGLHESILALPRGYDTPAARELFSQGQLQLLAIARAVAADPPILLLDEITANLDSGTERRVLRALELASRDRTVLSISHRACVPAPGVRLIAVGSRQSDFC